MTLKQSERLYIVFDLKAKRTFSEFSVYQNTEQEVRTSSSLDLTFEKRVRIVWPMPTAVQVNFGYCGRCLLSDMYTLRRMNLSNSIESHRQGML